MKDNELLEFIIAIWSLVRGFLIIVFIGLSITFLFNHEPLTSLASSLIAHVMIKLK